MHAAVWRTLRSTFRSRPPARVISGRQYLHSPRRRSFHSTPRPTSTPPTDPQDPPVEQDDSSAHDRDNPALAATPEDAAKSEEPEVIAKKLQRSKEMVRHYGSALKRSQRHNRSQDLPPIHIPNWFLKRNVVLCEEHTQRDPIDASSWALVLKNKQTGEPYMNLPLPISKPELIKSIPELIKCDKINVETPEDEAKTSSSKFSSFLGISPESAEFRLHFSVIAEIKATVAACLSVVRPELGISFPSAKTNLILHSPAEDSDNLLPELVHSIAAEIGADVVRLDAQDLAEIAGHYLGENSDPSAQSIRSLGYHTYSSNPEIREESEEADQDEEGQDDEDAQANSPQSLGFPASRPFSGIKGPSMMTGAIHVVGLDSLSKSPLLKALGLSPGNGRDRGGVMSSSGSSSGRFPSQNEIHWEDMKLSALLEALVDSSDQKRTSTVARASKNHPSDTVDHIRQKKSPKFFDYSLPEIADTIDVSCVSDILGNGPKPEAQITIEMQKLPGTGQIALKKPAVVPPKYKIIFIRDVKELGSTQRGSQILLRLQEIIRKRRADGEHIMIIGTTSSTDLIPELSKSGIKSLQSEGDDSFARTIFVPIGPTNLSRYDVPNPPYKTSEKIGAVMARNAEINLRHIQDMLRRLDPIAASRITDPEQRLELPFEPFDPNVFMGRVLSFDEVHRVALTAIGICLSQPNTSHISAAHVSLAMSLIDISDRVKFQAVERPKRHAKIAASRRNLRPMSSRERYDRAISNANKHEKRLLAGVINPERIKTTFTDVHAPAETIEALRTLTSLSLLRPEAFSYGVLATDKIPGLLLYGPPGTGKTLLAKAVAKESGATVLEVSGSEVYDMYVGEGEKNVRAIFSLARKLSPCVVFIDEADAIFGSRDGGRQRTSHREIINQFLKEWDGMNDLSVFIMVATNRPFDLDDAVLRRLPRRLLVDLPTLGDRKKILEIHLKGEQLDESVNIEELATRTPLYSGSDLKNLAVAAALTCVREENEQAAIAAAKAMSAAADVDLDSTTATESASTKKSDDPTATDPVQKLVTPQLLPGQKYQFPEKRTLHARHFEKALQEISASISEDMSSLNAVKKFDEQFGDRKGRRKKSAYGFGTKQDKDEKSARVRT
ncbi:AAA-domain-containing protein [Lepidopterella palustris CBS 459.81]|uniref:AAA-domain-containing protein n=1 Tax=Lepidopterella palustris CBS 459.81 TaxID=1314670 RepID=A0A8E2EFX9_9PEZI|nr:AAA-domain-containing protein [Lepidopterella palustris CBS 459.81]